MSIIGYVSMLVLEFVIWFLVKYDLLPMLEIRPSKRFQALPFESVAGLQPLKHSNAWYDLSVNIFNNVVAIFHQLGHSYIQTRSSNNRHI